MIQLLYQCRRGSRTVSEMEENPCTKDCLCWRNKEGCNGDDSLCRGDSICKSNKCVKRPDDYPTRAPTPSARTLIKDRKGSLYQVSGFMFDIKAKSEPLLITNFFLALAQLQSGDYTIQVYTKVGSHMSFSEKPNNWDGPIGEISMNGDGRYAPEILPTNTIEPQPIAEWQTRAFYITSKNSSPFYVTEGNNYSNKKKPLVENEDLKILEGCSLVQKFDNLWGECKNTEGGQSYNLWGGVEYIVP